MHGYTPHNPTHMSRVFYEEKNGGVTLNPALKAKHEELTKLSIRGATLLNETKTAGLTGEINEELERVGERVAALRAEIDSETKLEKALDDQANLERYLKDPVHVIPHGINQDSDSRKGLLKAGWEIKAGTIYAPTTLTGTSWIRTDGRQEKVGLTALYPEEVLFGDLPTDDDEAASFFKKTRAIFGDEYKRVYTKFMRTAVKHRSESMAFAMLTGTEQKALSEGSDSAGGYLVPPDIQAEVLVRLPQAAVMRQYARVQPTSRDILRWPAVAPNTTSGSIYSSGFVGDWAGETPAFTDTDPSFQLFDIPIRKVRCVTKLSNDFVADSSVNILAFMATNGAENMGLVEDKGFIAGIGNPLQPIGLINSGITTGDVEGSTADTISNTISNQGSAPKIGANVVYKLPSQYVSRARWLMRRSIIGKIRALTDAQARPLWPPYMGSGFADAPDTLFNAPVSFSDWMPDDGQDTQPVAMYGDFSQYIIGQRAQITSVVLRERFADTDQVGIVLFERVGGALWNVDSFRAAIC